MSTAREISREENRIPLKTDAFGSQTKVYLLCGPMYCERATLEPPREKPPDTPKKIIISLKNRKALFGNIQIAPISPHIHKNIQNSPLT